MLAVIKKEVPFVIRVSEHLLNLAQDHANRILEGILIFLKLFRDYFLLCSSEDILNINEYNKIIPRLTLILLAKVYLINYDFTTVECMQIHILFFFSRIMQNFSMRQISKCEYCYELAKVPKLSGTRQVCLVCLVPFLLKDISRLHLESPFLMSHDIFKIMKHLLKMYIPQQCFQKILIQEVGGEDLKQNLLILKQLMEKCFGIVNFTSSVPL